MAKELAPALSRLLAESRLPALGPGQAEESRQGELERLIPEAIRASGAATEGEMGRACAAGLWLRFDFLDESHTISQQIGSAEGSYWHGVMHRREGDFANASYWFRRAGELPFFDELGEQAARLVVGRGEHPLLKLLAKGEPWDPYRFVDLCKACINGTPAIEDLCKNLQELEWRRLFEHTLEKAVAANGKGGGG